MESYYGKPLQVDITELYYRITLWDNVTESYYGVIVRNHLHEKDPGDAQDVLGAPWDRGDPWARPWDPRDDPGTPTHAPVETPLSHLGPLMVH